MNFEKHLKESRLAKVSLIMLIIDMIACLYIAMQFFRYTGTGAGICAVIAVAAVGALLFLCNVKKTKAAIIIEVILAAALIIAVMLVLRINSLTGAIGRTTQYEAVQIVTLKDSEIEPGRRSERSGAGLCQ